MLAQRESTVGRLRWHGARIRDPPSSTTRRSYEYQMIERLEAQLPGALRKLVQDIEHRSFDLILIGFSKASN